MGKIGLAISPQNPDVVYAAIELDRSTVVFTGPRIEVNHGKKCQILYKVLRTALLPRIICKHKFDRLYLMNVRVLTSEDGGKPLNN